MKTSLPVSFKLWVEDVAGDPAHEADAMQIISVEHLSGDIETLQPGDRLVVMKRQMRGKVKLPILTLMHDPLNSRSSRGTSERPRKPVVTVADVRRFLRQPVKR